MFTNRIRLVWARVAIVLGFSLIIGSTAGALIDVVPAAAVSSDEVGAPTASAVTVNWAAGITNNGTTVPRDVTDPNYSNFEDIVFKVNQTANLTHQAVKLEWSGATPTSSQQFANNFMQVMQCWSDNPRSCQFGQPAQSLSDKSGFQVQTRSVSSALDPGQAPYLTNDLVVAEFDGGSRIYAYPFVKQNGESTFETGELFSPASTNEISAAPTASDGTGMINFEIQTTLDAPHLGCGANGDDGSPVPCYLIIVPRGSLDLNGQPAAASGDVISGSPLSYSAWKNRVVIPLDFSPVSASCPLGQEEVRILGSDVAQKAITSWQPLLCQQGRTYGFSRVGDDEARTQIPSSGIGSSHMAFVSGPFEEDSPYAPGVDYAPLLQSALVIGYNIDYSLYSNSSIYAAKNGTKVQDLKLNQRLVAKLLTQSYRQDAPGAGFGNDVVQANPWTLTTDPEFLELNPEFADFTRVGPQGLFTPFGNSDVNRHVWEWIRANSDAKAFLEGEADQWGMRVNPSYQALGLTEGEAPESFPKADLRTYTGDSTIPAYGTLDMRPYFNSLDETGMRTLRADGNVKTAWDPFKLPAGQYVALSPQPLGQRFSLAITDLATANRYGLDVAQLQGSVEGNFVAPTLETVSAAIDNRKETSIAGVTSIDWSSPLQDAYPLAEVIYAAVSICAASDDERAAYIELIEWATDSAGGQELGDEVGQLPRGYFPLTTTQREAAMTALVDIAEPADKVKRCTLPKKVTTKKVKSVPQKKTTSSTSSSTTEEAAAEIPQLFIREPFYGEGVVEESQPVVLKTLMAGGYIAGIPMLITGFLMQRKYGTKIARLK